jgi:hypothetical protein
LYWWGRIGSVDASASSDVFLRHQLDTHFTEPSFVFAWERRDDIHEAFLGLAVCLITHRHVQRLC